jgi:hypothetical protein
MIRVLAMISVAGFFLSVVCISLAVGMAGPDAVARGAWGWPLGDWGLRWTREHGHDVRFSGEFGMHDGPKASREIPWTGGESLTLDVPADLNFTQADGPAKIVVQGPRDVVDHVVLRGGRVDFDRPMFGVAGLTLTMTAPKITQFRVDGSGRLDISGYRQDKLLLNLGGDGSVTAHGAAESVQISISGSGDADLSGLATDGAQVAISGSGEAKVAPRTWARLDISGSGEVELLSHPPRVDTHVSGSGHVEQDGGGQDLPPPAADRT